MLRVLPSGRWVPRNQGWLNFWETRLVTVRKSLPPLMLDGTYLSRNFATLGPLTSQPPCALFIFLTLDQAAADWVMSLKRSRASTRRRWKRRAHVKAQRNEMLIEKISKLKEFAFLWALTHQDIHTAGRCWRFLQMSRRWSVQPYDHRFIFHS